MTERIPVLPPIRLLMGLSISALCAVGAQELDALAVAQLRSVSGAEISPDGRWAAYSLRVQRDPLEDENGSSWAELHVVDLETGESRPFVTGEVNVSGLGWSPNGRLISFLAKRQRDEHASIHVIPIDGGEARRLVAHKTAISAYQWRPDGEEIAFLAKETEDADLKKAKEKGFNAEAYEEGLRRTQLWIVSAEEESGAEARLVELEGNLSEIHWSPDGSRIALAVAPTPLIDQYYMYRRIRVVNAVSGLIVNQVENPGKLAEIAWNPSGTKLAFLSGEDVHDPSEGRLMVADLESNAYREVADTYLPNIIDIDWAEEDAIAFLAHDGCQAAMGRARPDGAEPPEVTLVEDAIVESFSMSGRHVVGVGHTATHPAEVFHWTTGEPRRLTNSNPDLSRYGLAKQEVLTYTARDGERIEGVLIHPLDVEPGQRYPLILMVHGGPESHVSNGWVTSYSTPGQVAAAQGFAVLYPNYRGSTGRGVPFAKAHQEDYGGKEFDDLLDGINHLVSEGLVDRERVGVTGGSYGGFASAWCATRHTEHFAAAVMFVGISNQISKSGTTDIADEMYLVHARKRVWEDWQFFLERSPIYYVEQARTPILILHGEEDTRVHPSQSLELYRNLKILGQAPVRYVRYPGEGHGNRMAAARYDYTLRLMRWMNHYAKGEGGEMPPFAIDHGLASEEPQD